ncbi:hypothetical protein AUEXF2481DRAFT_410604, partial [Aureobasidium subglaciale EXF-2481]
MRFSTAFALSTVAFTAMAAPVPQDSAVAAPGLLQDLSPEVVALLTALGLGGLAPPVGGIVSTLGVDVKKRQSLLQDLSPEVVDLLNRLGLSGLSAPVGGIVTTLGQDVKKRQAPGLLEDLSPEVVALLT